MQIDLSDEARERVGTLQQAGMSRLAIATAAQVAPATIARLVAGSRVRQSTALQITTVQLTGMTSGVRIPRETLDPILTQLHQAGWSVSSVAKAIGRTPQSLRRTLARRSISAVTHAKLHGLQLQFPQGAPVAPGAESPRAAGPAVQLAAGDPLLKGEPQVFSTRVPDPVAEAVARAAEELGLSKSKYLAMLAAHAVGMPEHAPHPVPPLQEPPMKTA